MKKARIVLTMVITILIINVFLAVAAHKKRGLNNLYYVTTGIFFNNGSARQLTYACLAPYRTFATSITQPTISPAVPLYASITLTITIVGGAPYTYPVVYGFPWNLLIYEDEDQ